MIPVTSPTLSTTPCANATGSMRKPVTMKKLGMNRALPKKSSLDFVGWSRTAALTASPARNAPTQKLNI
jgi:hypothetical protein